MVKHFEQLWEEAESVSTNIFSKEKNESIINKISTILNSLDGLPHEQRQDAFGEILIRLCSLSKKFNINVYFILRNKINEYKIDINELNLMFMSG